tara:strand:- start:186 stop:476 length:291 start_codon:yes stop_codon:yes gene_type:complete
VRARAILLLVKVRLTPRAQDKPRVRLALAGAVSSEPYLSLRALKAPEILKDRVLSKSLQKVNPGRAQRLVRVLVENHVSQVRKAAQGKGEIVRLGI